MKNYLFCTLLMLFAALAVPIETTAQVQLEDRSIGMDTDVGISMRSYTITNQSFAIASNVDYRPMVADGSMIPIPAPGPDIYGYSGYSVRIRDNQSGEASTYKIRSQELFGVQSIRITEIGNLNLYPPNKE